MGSTESVPQAYEFTGIDGPWFSIARLSVDVGAGVVPGRGRRSPRAGHRATRNADGLTAAPVELRNRRLPLRGATVEVTVEQMNRALAALPQVSVKLSGMPPELRDDQDLAPAVRPWLEVALDAFGADRAMVGSDWPISAMLPRRLAPGRWLSLVLDELAASPAEREQLSWRTASRFYGV
jgi:hypothetical protein